MSDKRIFKTDAIEQSPWNISSGVPYKVSIRGGSFNKLFYIHFYNDALVFSFDVVDFFEELRTIFSTLYSPDEVYQEQKNKIERIYQRRIALISSHRSFCKDKEYLINSREEEKKRELQALLTKKQAGQLDILPDTGSRKIHIGSPNRYSFAIYDVDKIILAIDLGFEKGIFNAASEQIKALINAYKSTALFQHFEASNLKDKLKRMLSVTLHFESYAKPIENERLLPEWERSNAVKIFDDLNFPGLGYAFFKISQYYQAEKDKRAEFYYDKALGHSYKEYFEIYKYWFNELASGFDITKDLVASKVKNYALLAIEHGEVERLFDYLSAMINNSANEQKFKLPLVYKILEYIQDPTINQVVINPGDMERVEKDSSWKEVPENKEAIARERAQRQTAIHRARKLLAKRAEQQCDVMMALHWYKKMEKSKRSPQDLFNMGELALSISKRSNWSVRLAQLDSRQRLENLETIIPYFLEIVLIFKEPLAYREFTEEDKKAVDQATAMLNRLLSSYIKLQQEPAGSNIEESDDLDENICMFYRILSQNPKYLQRYDRSGEFFYSSILALEKKLLLAEKGDYQQFRNKVLSKLRGRSIRLLELKDSYQPKSSCSLSFYLDEDGFATSYFIQKFGAEIGFEYAVLDKISRDIQYVGSKSIYQIIEQSLQSQSLKCPDLSLGKEAINLLNEIKKEYQTVVDQERASELKHAELVAT